METFIYIHKTKSKLMKGKSRHCLNAFSCEVSHEVYLKRKMEDPKNFYYVSFPR